MNENVQTKPELKCSDSYVSLLCYTLHWSCTPTNILIMPLYLVKIVNDFLLHSDSCQPPSASAHSQPSVWRLHLSLILFFPAPFSHGGVPIRPGHPCFCVLVCILSSFPNTPLSLTHPSLVLKSLTAPLAFGSCFYFSAPQRLLELELSIYMLVPFTSLSSWSTYPAIYLFWIVSPAVPISYVLQREAHELFLEI